MSTWRLFALYRKKIRGYYDRTIISLIITWFFLSIDLFRKVCSLCHGRNALHKHAKGAGIGKTFLEMGGSFV